MKVTKESIGRNIVRGGRAIRDAWLIVGATIVLILVLESGYRLSGMTIGAVANRPAVPKEPASPFEATDWAAAYWIGHQKEEAVRWEPYVYLRNPTFEAPHASVDEHGHRITPQPESAPTGAPNVRVFFLGGSTTFGWYQRAAHTIPAEAARRLQARLGSAVRVEVTNFGAPGRTFTQEILELMLQLRAGARPDVVVFYDGINDVMATVQNKRAGWPQNEFNREADFARGRRLAAQETPGVGNDLRHLRQMVGTALSRLQFVARIHDLARPTPSSDADSPSANELAKGIVDMYAQTARIVESLAATYGFEAIYVWQPTLLSTGKPLTEREKWLRRDEERTFVRMVRDVHRTVPELIGPALAPIAGDRFVEATDLFRDDAGEIYVDLFGHTYERANPRIVDAMMPALGPAVLRAASRANRQPRP